ncbi:hypothetical protein BDV93DRAFT_346069 [Ceratobasidium sp. AG-I]|nr:hypothetical protein BDV93DRAFT_346069 [Ceratobasidium sp. AG-I]
MEVSTPTNSAANDNTLMQTLFRGPLDKNPASGANIDGVTDLTLQYLKDAISIGDRLPNPENIEPAERRALLVAPRYEEKHPNVHYPELPFTINDAHRIHEMLVQNGYDPKNIRVLADRFEEDGLSDPSGLNINKSLDWLVEGSRPGDYRFFHFAGHGTRLQSKEGEGKRARVVSVTRRDDGEPSGPHGVVQKQIIPVNKVAYYNEAMVASYRPRPYFSKVTDEEYSLIRDKRLNEVFARLPEGCLLTVMLL